MSSQPLVIPARREDRLWVTLPGEHGVIIHAPTLSKLQASARAALALLGQDPPPVQVAVISPQLDALADVRRRYQAALQAAVRSLHETGASLKDIAQACDIRQAEVRELLEQARREESPPRFSSKGLA